MRSFHVLSVWFSHAGASVSFKTYIYIYLQLVPLTEALAENLVLVNLVPWHCAVAAHCSSGMG